MYMYIECMNLNMSFGHVIWIILLTDEEYSHEVYLVNIECDLLKNEIPFSMDLIYR